MHGFCRLGRKLLTKQHAQSEQNRKPRREDNRTHSEKERVEVDARRRADHNVGRIADEGADTAGIGEQRRAEKIGYGSHALRACDQYQQRTEDDDGRDVVEQQR